MKTSAQLIVITGFMAAGKTAVATALGRKLGCAMIDLDLFIADREKRTAQVIIDQDGEKRFRQIETLALHDALATNDVCIIALGGGTWTISENRELINDHNGFTVWLDAPFKLCWRRIGVEKLPRPLARDFTSARELYEKRRPSYQQAMLHIEIFEDQSIDAITSEIVKSLSEWKEE